MKVFFKDNRVDKVNILLINENDEPHTVTYASGWNCDCTGYTINNACRHVKMGEKIRYYLVSASREAMDYL